MKTYRHLYERLSSWENLVLAYDRARKGKTTNPRVRSFGAHWEFELATLHRELRNRTYCPRPLRTFILRDPKTRRISVSDFRDRVVHHALINILAPIFEPRFIADSYASRKGKGTLAAVRRFQAFQRRVTRNNKRTLLDGTVRGYVFKADIYHYFATVDQGILLAIIGTRVKDPDVLWLTRRILEHHETDTPGRGMPLGNWTSQFFANIYLDMLDQYVKHTLKARYYIRYVDDFVILHPSRQQLRAWTDDIRQFLTTLGLQLHPSKCRITPLHRGTTFLGYRVFPHHTLVTTRNLRSIRARLNALLDEYETGTTDAETILNTLQGWKGYAQHANTHHLQTRLTNHVINELETRTPTRLERRNVTPTARLP